MTPHGLPLRTREVHLVRGGKLPARRARARPTPPTRARQPYRPDALSRSRGSTSAPSRRTFSSVAARSPEPSTSRAKRVMPVRSDGRREPVGAQPRACPPGAARRAVRCTPAGPASRGRGRPPSHGRRGPASASPASPSSSVSTASVRRSAIWQTPADTWAAPAISSGERPAARACVRHSATISAFSSSPTCIPSSIGSPRSAASRTLDGEVQATMTSGPGAPRQDLRRAWGRPAPRGS